MEDNRKRYTKDEYISLMTNYIGQEKIEALNALPDYSSARLERLMPMAGKFGTLILRDGYIYRYHVSADGLLWTSQSGRLSIVASMQLVKMKVTDLLGLLWEISEFCGVIGDVPAFVNKMFKLEKGGTK